MSFVWSYLAIAGLLFVSMAAQMSRKSDPDYWPGWNRDPATWCYMALVSVLWPLAVMIVVFLLADEALKWAGERIR